MTSPHCLCCDAILDSEAVCGMCAPCLYGVIGDVMALRDAADLSVIVCVLRDAGAMALARAVVGTLPFVDAPPYEALTQ